MDSLGIAGITFACTFGGAMLGMYLRRVLPESHLSKESKEVVLLGTGFLATMAALVLGLLIASAQGSYAAQRSGLQQISTNFVVLDRTLKFYGPETNEIRESLRDTVARLLEHRRAAGGDRPAGLAASDISEGAGKVFAAIQNLPAATNAQKACQAQALQISADVARTRWLLAEGDEGSIPVAFVVVMVFWLCVVFVTFGLFSPPNATVIAVLFICALSVTGAMFLMEELDMPFAGLIQISNKPLSDALGQLGK